MNDYIISSFRVIPYSLAEERGVLVFHGVRGLSETLPEPRQLSEPLQIETMKQIDPFVSVEFLVAVVCLKCIASIGFIVLVSCMSKPQH